VANHLELKNINAGYEGNTVLRDFSLSVKRGELVALLGASGCGKTTVLKIIAGLHKQNSGEVWADGANISEVSAERRETAMVFQKPLLFPFLNVAENVGFGLKMRKLPKNLINEKVAEALGWVHLAGFEQRSAKQLSGGQEQRVALARALVTNPKILLLDEPFSALDARLRDEMRNLIHDLQPRLSLTTVFVTHDQEEAVSLADRIAFLADGNLAQFSDSQEFYTNPKTVETARFFGWKTIEGRLNGSKIETAIGEFVKTPAAGETDLTQNLHLAFHRSRARFVTNNHQKNAAENIISGILERKIRRGAKTICRVRLSDGETIEIEVSDDGAVKEIENMETGKVIEIVIAADAVRLFSSEQSR